MIRAQEGSLDVISAAANRMKHEDPKTPKSLLDEILGVTLAKLEKDENFDAPSLERLKVVAASGGLTKPAQVTAAIQPAEKVQ